MKLSTIYYSKKRFTTLFFLLIIVATTFVFYRNAMIDYPRNDHIAYMAERVLFPSNWDWFTHSITFSRTRLTYQGDYYLFRPGHMLVLSLQDIFVGNFLAFTGFFSIACFALLTSFTFLLLKKTIPSWLAFLFSMTLVTQPLAMEIVLWRHISPYILSLFFLLCACYQYSTQKNKFLFSLFLLLGMLFHEYIVASGIALFLVLCFFTLFAEGWRQIKSKFFFYPLLCSILVYFCLNLSDVFFHPPPSILGSDEKLPVDWLLLSLQNSFTFFIGSFRATFFSYTLDSDRLIVLWPFRENLLTTVFLSFFLLLLFISFFTKIYLHWKKRLPWVEIVVSSFALLSILSITSAVAIGRGTIRGMAYVEHAATYYYAITTGLWVVFVAFVVKDCFFFQNSKIKFTTYTLLSCYLLFLINTQLYQGNSYIKNNYPTSLTQQLEKSIQLSRNYFQQHSQECFFANTVFNEEGFPTFFQPFPRFPSLQEILPYYILEYSCDRYPHYTKTAVQFHLDQGLKLINLDTNPHAKIYNFTVSDSMNTDSKKLNILSRKNNRGGNFWEFSNPLPQWLEYQYTLKKIKVRSYTLAAGDTESQRMPSSWILEASNDKKNWAFLDQQQNQQWQINELKTFLVKKTKSYKYYRLLFLKGNTPRIIRIFGVQINPV